MEMAERAGDCGSGDSSDSDVAVVLQRKPKRRRILPGTAPMVSTVYSNKVTRSLKLLEMEKQLQEKQGDDLANDAIKASLPMNAPSPNRVLSDAEDVEDEQPEVKCERRNSSPSPPPSPRTPDITGNKRKRGLTSKIRRMEACLQDLGTVLSPRRNYIAEDNDVILVDPSTVPELTIKVRRRGEIFRLNICMTDRLQRLVELVASHLKVNASQVMLLRGEEELNTQETPTSLNITVADIIDCVVLSSSEGQDADTEKAEEKICLKVQGKDKQSQLTVTVGKNEPLKSLMAQYKTAMGLRKVCFMYEGKKLKAQNTAEQLGLESDDIIEAWT